MRDPDRPLQRLPATGGDLISLRAHVQCREYTLELFHLGHIVAEGKGPYLVPNRPSQRSTGPALGGCREISEKLAVREIGGQCVYGLLRTVPERIQHHVGPGPLQRLGVVDVVRAQSHPSFEAV